jgi:hypothetical protein
VGVDGARSCDAQVAGYDEAISLISSAGRPLKLRFERPPAGQALQQQQQQQQQHVAPGAPGSTPAAPAAPLTAAQAQLLPRLTAYYEAHNAAHLPCLPRVLRLYAGQLGCLFPDLDEKYGTAEATAEERAAYAAREGAREAARAELVAFAAREAARFEYAPPPAAAAAACEEAEVEPAREVAAAAAAAEPCEGAGSSEPARAVAVAAAIAAAAEDSNSKVCDAYENQRWLPVAGWGARLLPTDRSAWSDVLGKCDTPLFIYDRWLREGWAVREGWRVDGGGVGEGGEGGEGGWQYATDFPSLNWAPDATALSCVRRRRWTAVLVRRSGGGGGGAKASGGGGPRTIPKAPSTMRDIMASQYGDAVDYTA